MGQFKGGIRANEKLRLGRHLCQIPQQLQYGRSSVSLRPLVEQAELSDSMQGSK